MIKRSAESAVLVTNVTLQIDTLSVYDTNIMMYRLVDAVVPDRPCRGERLWRRTRTARQIEM